MLEFNFNWDKLSVSAGLTLRNFYFRLYAIYSAAMSVWEARPGAGVHPPNNYYARS